jgi:HK97 gp10 family phage protein
MADPTVTGLKELSANLLGFPEKLQRKCFAKMLRAGGRVIRDMARNLVPVISGRLRRSIRVLVIRNRRTGWMTARIAAGRSVKKDDPYWAIFVERGTKAHEERPHGAKSLFLAGAFASVVEHPGAAPHPFLEPALQQGAQGAVDAMAQSLREQIDALDKLPDEPVS